MGQRVEQVYWVASDGKRFKTEQAMRAHENRAEVEGLVSVYMDTIDLGDMDTRGAAVQLGNIANKSAEFALWLKQQGLLAPQAQILNDQRLAQLKAQAEAEKASPVAAMA